MPDIDHVTNDEGDATNEILQEAAPGKEVSRWVK
jgi:hypothetical protein